MMARSLTYSFTLNDEIALLICESNGTCASKTNRSARAARRGAGVTRERFLLSFARSYGPLTLYKSRLGEFPLPIQTRFGRERQGHQERVDAAGERAASSSGPMVDGWAVLISAGRTASVEVKPSTVVRAAQLSMDSEIR